VETYQVQETNLNGLRWYVLVNDLYNLDNPYVIRFRLTHGLFNRILVKSIIQQHVTVARQ